MNDHQRQEWKTLIIKIQQKLGNHGKKIVKSCTTVLTRILYPYSQRGGSRKDSFVNELAEKAEKAVRNGHLRTLYYIY